MDGGGGSGGSGGSSGGEGGSGGTRDAALQDGGSGGAGETGGTGGTGGSTTRECPQGPPRNGTSCESDGLECEYAGSPCGELAKCEDGTWVRTVDCN